MGDLETKLELDLQFKKRGGVIPVVVQDAKSKEVLMLEYANQQAWDVTLNLQCANFWSKTYDLLWTNDLELRQTLVDCDQDAGIYLVETHGKGACQTTDDQGNPRRTCFFRTLEKGRLNFTDGQEVNLQFEKRGGLIPAITQDAESKEVLMLAYVNPQALDETLKTNYATFWSTSRNELWTKGKTSGDYLAIKQILANCGQNALIYLVERKGSGACHTKDAQKNPRRSCFYRVVEDGKLKFVSGLE